MLTLRQTVLILLGLVTALKVVFDVHRNSKYSDDFSRRFDFTAKTKHVDVAENGIGDWVVFRQIESDPSKGGYIGIGQVESVENASPGSGMLYAKIIDFLAFPERVPLKHDGRYIETPLLTILNPKQIGVYFQQNPMRELFPSDFMKIVRLGFAAWGENTVLESVPLPRALHENGNRDRSDERQIVEVLLHRPFRERVFRESVGRACNFTCALTGWRISDGFGHYEAQAAHLLPVADGGPDVVHNGLCLSGTVHWMVDHHVASISEEFTLLTIPHLIPPDLFALLNASGKRLHMPKDQRLWPHAKYLDAHRAEFRRKQATSRDSDRRFSKT